MTFTFIKIWSNSGLFVPTGPVVQARIRIALVDIDIALCACPARRAEAGPDAGVLVGKF